VDAERVETLRNYLVEKLTEASPDETFFAVNDEATFAWIDVENAEVMLVTVQPAKFEVKW